VPTKRIRGRIIRILDKRTVIINLGLEDHVDGTSVFSILGEPEEVVDPFSKEKLGKVSVVKAKVKAASVYPRFTIAATKWTARHTTLLNSLGMAAGLGFRTEEIDEGELLVRETDVEPWKARSVIPVQVGDTVEVLVTIPESQASAEVEELPEGEDGTPAT
jgi:hypothetical protein